MDTISASKSGTQAKGDILAPSPVKVARVALVGVSGFADVHLKTIRRGVERGLLEFVAVTIINQEEEPEKCREIRELGAKIYGTFDEMIQGISGKVELCFIPTGIHLHAPMVISALEAGANVFVEKPAAATVQDVLEIKRVSERRGRFVAVGFQNLYDESIHWMKECILAGGIGELRSVKSMGLWPRTDRYYKRNSWAGQLRVGDDWMLDSPFNNAFAHQLNMICFLAGKTFEKPAELDSIEAELYRAREIDSPDTACMRIQSTGGVPLLFFSSHVSRELRDPVIVATGSQGEMVWEMDGVRHFDSNGVEIERRENRSWVSLRDRILAAVLKRISDPREFICGPEIALAHTISVNGAHESSTVHRIPEKYCSDYTREGEHWMAVDQIEEQISEAFDQDLLLSETGAVPWARRGKKFLLKGYKNFPAALNLRLFV